MTQEITLHRRLFIIFCLVFAGEVIFSLPFHVARFFRPTLLDVFNITNTQLGDIFGLYGIMAMLAYFPGGAIADRFSARGLMSFSLFATALGGIYYVQIPSPWGLALLFSFWGVTTIFLFWASMIKLTRQWGGENSQGKAFGILDGGRGLFAAAMASIAVLILSQFIPPHSEPTDLEQQRQALQSVIVFYSLTTLLGAALILIAIPRKQAAPAGSANHSPNKTLLIGIVEVIRQPKVWLQALIVLTAYSAYKSIDYFGLYATTVLGLNELASSQLVANAAYLRPIAAIGAGFIADRLSAGRVIGSSFLLLGVCYVLFIAVDSSGSTLIVELNIFVTMALVFVIRGIYFALLEETKLAGQLTGTAVGIISVVGFMPDIFFAPLAGRLIDGSPGADGFNQLFLILACLSLLGLAMATLLAGHIKRK